MPSSPQVSAFDTPSHTQQPYMSAIAGWQRAKKMWRGFSLFLLQVVISLQWLTSAETRKAGASKGGLNTRIQALHSQVVPLLIYCFSSGTSPVCTEFRTYSDLCSLCASIVPRPTLILTTAIIISKITYDTTPRVGEYRKSPNTMTSITTRHKKLHNDIGLLYASPPWEATGAWAQTLASSDTLEHPCASQSLGRSRQP